MSGRRDRIDVRLARLNWALTAVSKSLRALLHSDRLSDVLPRVCAAVVEQDVYLLAFVALTSGGADKRVAIVGSAGQAIDYTDRLELSWDEDEPDGQGPVGRAIRTGSPQLTEDTSDGLFADRWTERRRSFGIRSTLTVPSKIDGRTVGVLAVYASRPDAFGPEEMNLFEQLADEVAFVVALAEERERAQTVENARCRAEQMLRDEREFSDRIIESMPGVLALMDEQEHVIRWNKNLEFTTGFDAAEIAAMQLADFFSEAEDEQRRAAVRIAQEHRYAAVELNLRAKDGQLTPHCFGVVEIPSKGGGNLLLCVGIDLTIRRRAEEGKRAAERQLQQERDFADRLIHSLPGIMYVFDRSGNFLRWNAKFEQVSGYDAGEIAAMHPLRLFKEKDHARWREKVEEVFEKGESELLADFLSKNGCATPYYFTGVRIEIDGRTCLIGVGVDFTERRKAEEELRQSRADLARVARSSIIGEMTSSLAHEINQPLAAIVTNSDAALRWLSNQPANIDETRDAIKRTSRDARRVHEIIQKTRSLLTKGEVKNAHFDIRRAVEEVLIFTGAERRSADITVEYTPPPELPDVFGDRVQIQQVILNLVLNGVEAMKEVFDRTRTLALRTEIDDSGDMVVEVRDAGVGLSPENELRLFDRFFTTKATGTGMGLAISRSIIDAHGGKIWATPAVPHGASFYFTLPMTRPGDER